MCGSCEGASETLSVAGLVPAFLVRRDMIISELEDLQVIALDNLQKKFPGITDVQEEEVISTSAVDMSIAVTDVIKYFKPGAKNPEGTKESVLVCLNEILRSATVCAFILKVDCPLVKDVEDNNSSWPQEVIHCGILASVSLQNRLSDLVLDYFLEDDVDPEEVAGNLWDVISLVDVISQRLGSSFKEVLVL